ncbi:hypothetical protein [Streptomyces alanosinicus]|uniref:hypothetical protein n=1 Tax=Streptomyces alanosinicus TaxID=68171 RepID=UPI0016790629|nr:hypothetical protein [Streptomyces alanosinicus]
MEQRIGASSKPSEAEPAKAGPVTGAGFDPAFIPGLTAPSPTKPGASEPRDAAESTGPKDSAEPEKTGAGEANEPAGAAEDASEAVDEGSDGDGPDDGGPVFEAADRRAKVVADRKGVRLRLDEESCEFRWDEIAAVETESPRFGKRYTITVHTPERRWYPIEIEAAARSRFAEWDEQLDAVLDAYFEDAEDKPEPEDKPDTA